jgi:hypothetical protein
MAEEHDERIFVCTRCGHTIYVVGFRPADWPADVCGTCWHIDKYVADPVEREEMRRWLTAS